MLRYFLACLKPGDTFMGLNLDHGGHLSHGSAVNTSGILYHAIGYNLNKETGRVDYDEMEKLALEHRPENDYRWRFGLQSRVELCPHA